MLVLARKQGEEIKIGTDIIVKVLKISTNQVQIGVSAPKELFIRRIESEEENKKKLELNEA